MPDTHFAQRAIIELPFSIQVLKIISENVDKKMLQNIESRLISCFNPLTNNSNSVALTPEFDSQGELTEIVRVIVS